MAEEKEEKKKPGIVRRILKWIGLGLLTVLIILGLIFQAPWKVTVLLIVFLLACTLLPKQLRKWFWLSVGVIIIALIIWVFLPEDDTDWRPYTFDDELAALEAKRAIPDEENAAIIYNQLLESHADEDFNMPEDFPIREPWKSQDHPEIAEWLKQHQMTIQTLMEAAKIEKCRFPIAADSISLGQSMERLGLMRKWAYLLISVASSDIAEGRTKQALEKHNALLQIAGHAYQQVTLVEMMVGLAVEALALRQFDRFIVTGAATEEHLSAIEEALEEIKHDWSYDLPRILEGEKLIMKNFLGMFYEVNSKGKIRLIHDPTGLMRASFPEEMPPLTYWQRKLFKIATIWCWFFLPSTPQKAGKIIDESYEKYYAMAEPDFDWQKGPRKFSPKFRLNFRYTTEFAAGLLEESYHRVHDIYLRLLTDKRGSRIIVALRRYKNKNGFWPVNLDDVKSMAPVEIFVDPTNGGDFVYEITEENFRLYSKGKNGIDEDGERDEIAGADDWLIWPPRTGGCETEEENADDEQQ